MSDVLINGMEMPNRCFECIFLTTVPNFFCLAGKRDLCAEHGINISRPDWCPLIEVPPHGDLVDRNYLIAEYDRQHKGPAGGARRIIEDAPPIIEGSEE